ncbi:MAG: hypothetical protein P8184_15070 [Calditrichia bacterium]
MKYCTLFFAILVCLKCSSCSKHYQGDIDIFPLKGGWFITAGDTSTGLSPAEKTSGWQKFLPPLQAPMPSGNSEPFYWLRKDFVLRGHFVDPVIYLYPGYLPDSSVVYLNGRRLNRRGTFLRFLKSISHPQFIYEISLSQLHFGKRNQLMIRLPRAEIPDSLLSGKRGIYSRLGFLHTEGYTVKLCPYDIERDLHARLEDFSASWMNLDTLQMKQFLSPDFAGKQTNPSLFEDSILQKTERQHPQEIELYRPGFYCSPDDSTVLVLGNWIFHYPCERKKESLFFWEFKRFGRTWKISDIL